MYFANPTTGTAELMASGRLGFIDTPLQGNKRPPGVAWCADNGCFSDKWEADKWWRFLVKNAPSAGSCLFATAPDVVGDHEATLERSRVWLPKIRNLGYLAAFVAQDGATPGNVPWDDFDVLFIGGAEDDMFKLGPAGRAVITEAKKRGMWVHMGRVNSRKRYRYADAVGCDSVDGTYLTFGPDVNIPKLLRWVNQPSLWEAS
jgi:hypothetical protein